MKTLIEKVKAGSLIEKQDLVDALKWSLNKETFHKFYNGLWEDYITGSASSDEGKALISSKVNERLAIMFSPIMAMTDRLNRADTVHLFVKEHFDHGIKLAQRDGEYHLSCEKCKMFVATKNRSPK